MYNNFMKTIIDVQKSIQSAYSEIVKECRLVLGSELHYQAMIHHLLRTSGSVPFNQMGMNVKKTIENCQTEFL